MLVTLVLMILAANPWTSIHHMEYTRHPYYEPHLTLISEKTSGDLTHVVYGFLPHWRGEESWGLRLEVLSHVAWFGIELDAAGQVEEYNGWPHDWEMLKADIRSSGTRFDLTVTCFDWSGVKVHNLLSDSVSRAAATANVLAESQGCDGVCIDFERPADGDREMFADFIEGLADSLHARGMSLSVAVTAVNWGDRIDAKRIAGSADYVFIMGYDFHYPGSAQSGPVAPLEGETFNVTSSVDYYIEASDSAADRLLLGVPYYGYDWPTADTLPYSATMGSATAYIYSSAITRGEEYGILWHDTTSTPWYHYQQGTQTRQCWFDDTASLELKYDLAKNRNLAGVGVWALTYDDGRDELWRLLGRNFSTGIKEEPWIVGQASPDLPGLLSLARLNDYLARQSFYELYDATGRKLTVPSPGILFVRTAAGVAKVVVVR